MKNSLRIHKWTHNEFNIFILGVLTHPHIIIYVYLSCEKEEVFDSCFFVNLSISFAIFWSVTWA